jgi:L-ascorbate metabolism protein UlaG (beta-lactamase superfamily)
MTDRVTFVGHSTARLELGGTTLLTDGASCT